MLDSGEDSHLTRTRLVNSVVKALEKDSDWVYLYDAADELVVPEIQAENDYEETLQMVIQVCGLFLHRSECLLINECVVDTPHHTSQCP